MTRKPEDYDESFQERMADSGFVVVGYVPVGEDIQKTLVEDQIAAVTKKTPPAKSD